MKRPLFLISILLILLLLLASPVLSYPGSVYDNAVGEDWLTEYQNENGISPQIRNTPVPTTSISSAQIYLNEAITFYNANKYNEAIISANKAITLNPRMVSAWNVKACAMSKLNRENEALLAFDEALALSPDSSLLWFNKAISLDKLGRYEEAVYNYNRALALEPGANVAIEKRDIAASKIMTQTTTKSPIPTQNTVKSPISTQNTPKSPTPPIWAVLSILLVGLVTRSFRRDH